MCVCVMAVAVYSATHNLYLIFKTVLIYCNLYKVVKICHKFSMPTVILCNSVLKTHSLQKVTSTLFSYPLLWSWSWWWWTDSSRATLYEDGALVVCTALRSSPSHAGVQFTGCSAMSNLARAGTWLHVRQCVCACVCVVYTPWNS